MLDRGDCTKLLPHLNGIVGAVIRALTAGNAFLLINLGNVVASGSIGRVIILGNAQSQTAFRLAVADGKGFTLMQGGDLMNASSFIAFLNQRFGFCYRNRFTLTGPVEHICHMAHEDAQTFV